MKQDKVLSMIGLAVKAGKVVSGEFSVEKAVKHGASFLVIVSEEASDNTRKKFSNMCEFYEVPIRFYGNRDDIGAAMGKEYRVSLAITDEGFGKAILKLLNNNSAL